MGLGSWLVGPEENWVTKLKKYFPKHYQPAQVAAKHSIKLSLPFPSPRKRLSNSPTVPKTYSTVCLLEGVKSNSILKLGNSGLSF